MDCGIQMSDCSQSKNIAADGVQGPCGSLPQGLSADEARRIDKALARLAPVAQRLRQAAAAAAPVEGEGEGEGEAGFQRALRELSLD